jgi:hypothetical protein
MNKVEFSYNALNILWNLSLTMTGTGAVVQRVSKHLYKEIILLLNPFTC